MDQNVVTEANAAFFALFKWGQVPPWSKCPLAHACGRPCVNMHIFVDSDKLQQPPEMPVKHPWLLCLFVAL